MVYCAEYCLEMPDDFPADELIQFMTSARQVLINPDVSPAWKEFGGASNLIGWRFRATSEYWSSFKAASENNHDEVYQKECALFGMFTAGVSCIESTTYALAALASHTNVLSLKFGPDEQRICSPNNLIKWLKPHATGKGLYGVLAELLTSSEWRTWVDLRNRMMHRSNLPRISSIYSGSMPPATKPINFAPTSSTPLVEAEFSDFDALHIWLAETLRKLLIQGHLLANA